MATKEELAERRRIAEEKRVANALEAKRALSESVPGSTVIVASVTFKLEAVKSGELLWKAKHADLNLAFKSRVGESRNHAAQLSLLAAKVRIWFMITP